jgi:ribonucleoside-diphosphate reductase alpha chain
MGEPPVGTVAQEETRPTAVAVQPVSRDPEPVMAGIVSGSNGNGNGHAKVTATLAPIATGSLGTTKVAFSVSADSPSCAECGSIMVRNGSCYKCLNCGSTSGCS